MKKSAPRLYLSSVEEAGLLSAFDSFTSQHGGMQQKHFSCIQADSDSEIIKGWTALLESFQWSSNNTRDTDSSSSFAFRGLHLVVVYDYKPCVN